MGGVPIKGFKIINGDVVIQNNQIQMIDGNALTTQAVESIIGTNKKEWFLNEDEGINFNNILVKNVDDEMILNEIVQGLAQVDQSFSITSFDVERDGRELHVSFSAKNSLGEEVKGEATY